MTSPGLDWPDGTAAAFDIDGTLTHGGDVWSRLLAAPQVSRERKLALYGVMLPHYAATKVHLAGQAGFRDRWVRRMAWLMSGWPAEDVQALYRTIVTQALVPDLRQDVVELLRQHKARGHVVVLVSTMFAGIVEGLAAYLDADAGLGSVVAMGGGCCLGRIEGATCSGPRKVEFLRRYFAEYAPRASLAHCTAYADSRSDLPLLAAAGCPVAVYPDNTLRAAASENNWTIYAG